MSVERVAEWDRVTDVIVIGSGAAGLAAAVAAHDGGAEVLVVEKAPMIGGTTGVSGGMPWVPLNRHMEALGVSDSADEAVRYIRRIALGREPDPELISVYVSVATEALQYLEANTPLRMNALEGYADYYPHLEGAKSAGRSVEPAPFDAGKLGEWAQRVRTSPHLPWLTIGEGALSRPGSSAPDFELAARRQAEDTRVLGSALVSALMRGLLDRGVLPVTGTRVEELVLAGGAVVGVSSSIGKIGARRGVVLACGGFEWNQEMVGAFIGHMISPLSPPFNEGDGLRMGLAVGAAMGNMTSYWGQLGIYEPGFEIDGKAVPQFAPIRFAPGAIIVNGHAQRFVNEDIVYNDFHKVTEFYDPVMVDYPNSPPYWIIFDQQIKETSSIIQRVPPGKEAPNWIHRAATLSSLAELMGLDPAALEKSVARWNEQVVSGIDGDHGRGAFLRESGSQPELSAITQAPFYGVQLVDGTLGTNGGLRIDGLARVKDQHGGVIPGLYAAGNVTASVFGSAYPGGGSTIGPALTFGYLAGRHAAGRF